jgi:hypothetical protein
MPKNNRVTALHIDGTRYSDDDLARDADERVRSLPYLAVTAESLKSGTAFGFSNEETFERWIAQNNLRSAYDKINKTMSSVKESQDAIDRIAKEQAAQVQEDTQRFLDVLKKNNVASDDSEGILRLGIAKKLGNSYTLHRYPDYGGLALYFNSYTPYPNYKWFGFNNMASSAIHWGAAALLCQTTWYRDKKILLAGVIYVSHLGDWPFYFNNLTSSSCGA